MPIIIKINIIYLDFVHIYRFYYTRLKFNAKIKCWKKIRNNLYHTLKASMCVAVNSFKEDWTLGLLPDEVYEKNIINNLLKIIIKVFLSFVKHSHVSF